MSYLFSVMSFCDKPMCAELIIGERRMNYKRKILHGSTKRYPPYRDFSLLICWVIAKYEKYQIWGKVPKSEMNEF